MKSQAIWGICGLLLFWANVGHAVQPQWINDGASPMISEFMASNSNVLKDDAGESSDWCELYNPTDRVIDLYGWYLSDSNTKLYKWRLPQILLEPGQYKIIYLSNKNSVSNPDYLHANFKLEAGGENLILTRPDGQTRVWYFEEAYPEQFCDISYGWVDGTYEYLKTPTPGAPNVNDRYLPAPKFSVPHGYYNEAFQLTLNCAESDITIYYTLDCSAPGPQSIPYSGPISIEKTTVVRAVACSSSGTRGLEAVATYVFLADLVTQPDFPEGYPTTWGPYTAQSGYAPADYGMDPEVCASAAYKDRIRESFFSIPTVSLVTDRANLFSDSKDPELGGIYYYTGAPITNTTYALGKDWQRPASAEYFLPGGTDGFQVNCGVQLNGGHSRRPEKSPKHSFRLLFQKEYGPGRLQFPIFDDSSATTSFDRLILRSGFNNTWIHSSADVRKQSQYIYDSWTKDAMKALEHPSAHNKFAHLFLNGMYWGLYNICERIDDEFMSSYGGGQPEDYDVIKDYTEVLRGNLEAWESLWNQTQTDMSQTTNYQKLLGRNADGTDNSTYDRLLDEVNLIDYMLVNFYAGNNDWDHHNWISARNRTTRDGFKFLPWDSELLFTSLNINVTSENNPNCPSGIFQKLLKNPEFKILLADRIYQHFFNDGLLTPEQVLRLWNRRAYEVQVAMIGESARWGDYRRDVHPNPSSNRVYTLDGDWIPANTNMLQTIFPNRTAVVIDQLIKAGYYPSVDPPAFPNIEQINLPGDRLALRAPAGIIYCTLDGSDPRSIGGAPSKNAQAYQPSDSLTLSGKVTLKARTLYNSVWSALAVEEFDLSHSSGNFHESFISELHLVAYPNPTADRLTVKLVTQIPAELEVTLVSMTGAKFLQVYQGPISAGTHLLNCNTSALAAGVYLCKARIGQTTKVVKINVCR